MVTPAEPLPLDLADQTVRDAAVRAMQHSLTVTDPTLPDNPLVYVNPAFERMTGYAAADVVGRNCRFLQGPDTDPVAVARVRAGLAAAEPVTEVLLNYRKDGTPFWNELAISPVYDAAGGLTHYVGVQTDVTVQIAAQAERDAAYRREREARADAESAQVRLALLATASAQFDASLDVDAIVDRLLRILVAQIGDWAITDIVNRDGSVRRRRGAHRDDARMPEVAALCRRADLSAPLRAALNSDEPVALRAAGPALVTSNPALARTAAQLGVGSALVVPLRSRHRAVGVLTLLSGVPDGFGPAEVALVVELGRRAGIAMDNAQTFTERDHVARVLQQSLLPPTLPDVPGVSVATRYRPAGEGMEVGGDFYDLFVTSGGFGLVIGDVCGRGPDAAAITGLARHTVRAAGIGRRGPREVLELLNRALLADDLGDRFLTAAYAHLAPRDSGVDVVVSVGGHPPLLRVTPGGDISALGTPGSLIGAFPEVDLVEDRAHLAPGDVLVLITDGVLEASGPTGLFGEVRLTATIRAAAAQGAEQVADAILGAVLDHTGGELNDDLAIVVVSVDVTPEEPVPPRRPRTAAQRPPRRAPAGRAPAGAP